MASTNRPSPFDVMFYSVSVREFVKRVFADPDPCHEDRLDAARRIMRDTPATVDDFCVLVDQEANWWDYDPVITRSQALSVARFLAKAGDRPSPATSRLPGSGAPRFNAAETGWQVPTWAGAKNRAFFADAIGGAYQKASERTVLRSRLMMFNPSWAFYRTVAGYDHTLGVVDIDGTDLDAAWSDAKRVAAVAKPDFLKFSGRRGFHLVYRLDAGLLAPALAAWGLGLCSSAGVEVGHQEASAVDPSLWTPNHLIRGYSINLKSKLYSIEVDVTEPLDSILERARTPEWQSRGFARSSVAARRGVDDVER